MNTYKLTYPDSPCVHTFQTGEELGPFCERTFGSIEAMIARGVTIDHPGFEALTATSSTDTEVVEEADAPKTRRGRKE